MSINRTFLAAFHSVATAGSFTVAARDNNVSQSTLSVQVGRLEKTYGCRLFLRRGRQIALTETGRALYSLTSRQFEAEREAEALLTGSEGGISGHLRIGAASSVRVVEFLKTFSHSFPRSTFTLELSNSQRVIRDVSDGNLDIGVIAFPVADPRLEKLPLLRDELLVLVGPEHEWASRTGIEFGELTDQTLILRERGSRTRQLVEDSLAARRVSPLKMVEINEWSAVREFVRAHLGVALVPESEAWTMPEHCKIRISDLQLHLTQFMIYRSDRKALSTLKAFLEIVESQQAQRTQRP